MGSQRSLLRSVSAGTAKRKHSCKGNKAHAIVKDDRILIVKIDRDDFHYCLDCATKFIATARTKLTTLEDELFGTAT
ncbi:hypothetical protein [Salinibacterium sp. TMP30]|uniref:hypothetical protein n=1 Tax=Salinibacterium sp. TMP30 TaxID=3138237 RepID=UPI003139F3C3